LDFKRGISNTLVFLSRIKSVRFIAQKLGLLAFLANFYSRLRAQTPRGARQPVVFLGERLISQSRWAGRLHELRLGSKSDNSSTFNLSDYAPLPPGRDLVCSVISSIYKPGYHLQPFLRNLTEQSIFDRVDLILIGVSLEVDEVALLTAFYKKYPNVNLINFDEKISIYHAWNLGVREAKSDKITNMNVDDIRHFQSLEIQVRELEGSPSAGVVYQDVYYMYEYLEDWPLIEGMGVRSSLPVVSTSILASGLNAPHNAPMWRRELHVTIGDFDESFLSAGDHDFWIRASIFGVEFQKSKYAHASYFINPDGMSTKVQSPGVIEGAKILDKYKKFL
jgi:GT2 family glycosyltransferase